MSKTPISWTKFTWNPITGCTKVSEGCRNCYSERMHKRLTGMGSKNYQHPFSEVRCHPERLDEVARWRKPRTVFVNSMSDTFHPDVPIDFIWKLFNVIVENPQHTFQILTKRIDRAQEVISDMLVSSWKDRLPDNVWLGVSVENQKALDRIVDLCKTPAVVKFVSFEPLLEDLELQNSPLIKYLRKHDRMFDWAIIGCESGQSRRKTKKVPCPDCRTISKPRAAFGCTCCRGYGYVHESQLWTENIITQFIDAGIPVHIKQLELNGKVEKDITKFPKHLQLQEKPEAA